MEENKFEKQVRQKMGELQIQPSEVVWKKIEARVEKRKDHKWGLIILFLFIGLVLCGGYWLWNKRQERISADYKSEKTVEQNLIKGNKTSRPEINPVPGISNKQDKMADNIEAKKNDNKIPSKKYHLLNGSKGDKKIKTEKNISATFSRKNEITSDLRGKAKTEITSAQQSENVKKEVADSIHEKPGIDSLSKHVESNVVTKTKDTSGQRQSTASAIKKSDINKWKLGFLFSGGLSGLGSHFLELQNAPVYSSPGALNSGQQSGFFSSPVLKSNLGFLTGIFAQKDILEKSKLIIGLNFKSFKTTIELNDSSGVYTSRSAANKYVDHFNFIEIPVSVKIGIGKGKKIPLHWQGGVMVPRLLNSNALQYNEYTGYYYKDNSIFNRTQFGFNTALSVSLISKQKTSVLIGPYFYYEASKIANEGLYSKKHFVFAGLQTEIIFGK
jgi:hypothetical protein